MKKFTKNDELFYQVKKLARQNNCYKLNKPSTFFKYIEGRNNFKYFFKTGYELAVDDDLM